jgi:hypothetical protein
LRDPHDEYIAASEALSVVNRGRQEELGTATTMDEVNAILADDPDYLAAVERQKAACRVLADHAEDEDLNTPGLAECNKVSRTS